MLASNLISLLSLRPNVLISQRYIIERLLKRIQYGLWGAILPPSSSLNGEHLLSIYTRNYKSLCASQSIRKLLLALVFLDREELLWPKSWKCLLFSSPRGELSWALFGNRDKTKDVIISIILGFSAILTRLLCSMLRSFNGFMKYEEWTVRVGDSGEGFWFRKVEWWSISIIHGRRYSDKLNFR